MTELFSAGFRITALILLIFLGYKIITLEKRSFRKNIFLFFILTVIGYNLAYWEDIISNEVLFQTSFVFAVSLPFFFWLAAKALFDDSFKRDRRFRILLITMPLINNLLYFLNGHVEAEFYHHFHFIPYLMSVIFICLVIYESLRNRESDLILSRLKMRNVFMLFSSFMALISVYFFFVEDPLQLPPAVEFIQNMMMCVFLLLFINSQFEYRQFFKTYTVIEHTQKPDPNEIIKRRILEKLERNLIEDKMFKEEGLTITLLSEKLEKKEYQVRRAINHELGYSNFNTFINHYRIEEACKLIKVKKQDLTFQEIAYQMGYQSVVTFNRAFKNKMGVTPGEYAKEDLDI